MAAVAAGAPPDWVRSLRWKLTGLLILKLGLLTMLWVLFFSSAHRTAVDAALTGSRFAVTTTQDAAAGRDATASGRSPTSRPTELEKTRD